jgi:hypothetical protein
MAGQARNMADLMSFFNTGLQQENTVRKSKSVNSRATVTENGGLSAERRSSSRPFNSKQSQKQHSGSSRKTGTGDSEWEEF